jgi:cytochrome c oxidase subunit 4
LRSGIYLGILTALELIVAYAHIPKALMVGLLVGLASAKAVLVAMYFMHLRFERRGLAIIAFTPIALVIFLTFMLVPDLSTRPYARHHMGEVVRMEHALSKDLSGMNPNVSPRRSSRRA